MAVGERSNGLGRMWLWLRHLQGCGARKLNEEIKNTMHFDQNIRRRNTIGLRNVAMEYYMMADLDGRIIIQP